MLNNKYIKLVMGLTLVMLSIVVSGCSDLNEVKQQGTPVEQQVTTNKASDRIEVANQAAIEIVSIPGVKQANVLVTQNNAYVAAVLDGGQKQLSGEIEDQIAFKVKETDPSIQNVYVSTNPNFVERINAYVIDVQQGRPVIGFLEEFNELVQRIFPNAR